MFGEMQERFSYISNMIVDRIFSLVNKRRISVSLVDMVEKAEGIRHPNFVFEKLPNDNYNVVPTKFGFWGSIISRYEYKLAKVNGTWKLVAQQFPYNVIFQDLALVLICLFAFIEPTALLIVIPCLILHFLFLIMIRHVAFNEIEFALRNARYNIV